MAFISGAAAESGYFIKVDPAGTYLEKLFDHDTPKKPTSVKLKKLGLRAYDYMGLRREGDFDAGPEYKDNIKTMVGVFAGRRHFRYPGSYGQQIGEVTLAPDIKEDFGLFGQTTIVRIPPRARHLKLGPNDEYFQDNTDPDSDYGLRYTLPNSSPKSSGRSTDAGGAAPAVSRTSKADLADLVANLPGGPRLPEAEQVDFSSAQRGSLRVGTTTPVRKPQYRGWHDDCSGIEENACWAPNASKFNAYPGAHFGIDIFAPQGTHLRAPAKGKVTFFSSSGSWGKYAVTSFRVKRRAYHIVYAHLDGFDGLSGRSVKRGEIIARAGCSGIANPGPRCGDGSEMNKQGARTDHVHVVLIEKEEITGAAEAIHARDIIAYLGWKVAMPR